jgi:cytochrome c oxidase subunit 4
MDAHSETHVAADGHHESPEEFKKHLRSYYVVFVALLCLTAITVGVAYLKLERPIAIAVALVIASIKAGLVAAVFMHLISEKKVIFAVLLLTAFFFVLVMVLPSITLYEHRHVITGMGG